MPRGRLSVLILVLTAGLAALPGCNDDGEGDPPPGEGERLIVSIGDSVASGEGNPAQTKPRWLDPARCHRSETSGQWIAAMQLIRANPEAELGFRSYACSGAAIEHGLTGPFDPWRFQAEVPAQLDRVDELTPPAEIAALMISVGGNDLGFSNIVEFCITKEPCQQSRAYGPAREWAREHGVEPPTLDEFVTERLRELRTDYEKVDGGIPAEIDRSRVIIVEYFDPTRSDKGTYCALFRLHPETLPDEGRVSPKESEWAHDRVLLRLNQAIADAVSAYHWTLVDRVANAFDGHGGCTAKGQRWVLTLPDSLKAQFGHRGTLHPNEAGHRATAELIRPKLAEALGLPADNQP